MRMNVLVAVTLSAGVVALAGCKTGGGNSAAGGACRPDAAEALAGMERLSDQQAMQMTGATLVRQVAPGQPVTMDYREDRVTIETDPATGKIVRASCG